jgi:hypothetical protein
MLFVKKLKKAGVDLLQITWPSLEYAYVIIILSVRYFSIK